MSITNDILGPLDPDTMRIIFLYVGQGEATLVLMPNGQGQHLSMLIDCNLGASLKGINVPTFLKDILPSSVSGLPLLDVFVNTHPHSDHLGGLDEVCRTVQVGAVWHSGHVPSSAHEGPYGNLDKLIRDVRRRGGAEIRLEGSRVPMTWGAGEVHVLSPAEYIVDSVADETPEQRDARIHDQCAVLRLSYGSPGSKTSILITGDSDKKAWIRITGYHGRPEDNRVHSHIFSAPHHGSYTFFKDRNDDPDPYEEHLRAIAPERIIISAPDSGDSKYGHPDGYALERYENAVGKDFVHHMGSRGWSFFVDAYANGEYTLGDDRGELARAFDFDDDGGGGTGRKPAPAVVSRVERSRPMGSK
jgi:competence protein ComEC